VEIYFDETLIEPDYYAELSNNFELFEDTFSLGSTATNTFSLSVVKEAVTSQPQDVIIKNNGSVIATLVVDNITENDDNTYTYELTDKMVDLEFNYDASAIFQNGSATLYEIAQDICNKIGVELATANFRGYDKNISWYDNTRTAREYIGYIAELNGGYAQIGSDGKLYFIKQNTQSVKEISIDDCEDFKIGEKHQITRVIYEAGALKYEFGNEAGNTVYLNSENVFITEESEVEAIYDELAGFTFYSFSTSNCPIDFDIKAGQIITFIDENNNKYPTIAGYDLTYFGDWYGGYDLDVATKKQEETQVKGNGDKIKDLAVIVDRDTNLITQKVQEIDEQNQKISKITQTVNELNSKISDIADITTSAENLHGTVNLENINQSEPIYMRIYPTTESISYLYPSSSLYPGPNLFLKIRTLRFNNTTTNEYFDYILPDDLLYCNGTYDEFILDYDSQKCVINKRVGYDTDGNLYELENETTVEYNYPKINLTDGNYTVSLLGYTNAYIQVRLMAQNIYTTQFATKAELNSEISQTSNEIKLSVDEKLNTYPTKTEMNSAITMSSNNITSTVNSKFGDYSTTTQMNSAISQKANEITSSVSKQYATKSELTTAKSEIKQTTDSITSTVSKKVGNNEIISKINQSAETVGINANKINLSANDILNLLAGNTINLTSKNIVISSDKFSVNKNGKVTCSDINITGGNISMNYTGGTDVLRVIENNNTSTMSYMTSNVIAINRNGGHIENAIFGGNPSISVYVDGGNSTYIESTGIRTPKLTQTSLVQEKKNFEKMEDNALDIINEIDIYKYNLKSEKDTDKKHIGFVIGDDYNYSKEVTSIDNQGVDNYSFTSLCCKAIQELIQENKKLTQNIEEIKKEIKGGKNAKD